MALKELLMHVPDPTGYQAFVGLLRNLKVEKCVGLLDVLGRLILIPNSVFILQTYSSKLYGGSTN